MEEPSILDYIKSLFSTKKSVYLKKFLSGDDNNFSNEKNIDDEDHSKLGLWMILGLFFGLIAQFLLEPPRHAIIPSIILYSLMVMIFSRELKPRLLIKSNNDNWDVEPVNQSIEISKYFPLSISFFLFIFSFILFKDNRFTFLNVGTWLSGIVILVVVFWKKNISKKDKKRNLDVYFLCFFLVFLLIVLFFRIYKLDNIPSEMFSDHAEKLLDVMDVLDGQLKIFFTRNTGREALQFYLTALIIQFFHTGISFLSLKLGTVIAGIMALPFVYLVGKELFNKWVGLYAFLFAGISYWHNVISRIGLRFPFYPLFVSSGLYYFIKGIRLKDTNSIVIAGLLTGLGLHGYSPFRIFPIFLVAFLLVWSLLEHRKTYRKFLINCMLIYSIFVSVMFLPLMRYMISSPENFHYRALSRMTSLEKTIDNPLIFTFIDNFFKSAVMFFYRNGVTWVTSIPNRPALEIISAVFFICGIVFLIKRVIVKKRWDDALMLVSIPILMLPSTLSLAYPQENPALNRSSGALVTVFVITGLGFYVFFSQILKGNHNRIFKIIIFLFGFLLILISIHQNYQLVFIDFSNQYDHNAWNTSEIGSVIQRFVDEGYDPFNIYVVPYPHWVDTRLVGINAGFPRRDFALWREQIQTTIAQKGNKLFILKPEDQESLDAVELVYPWAEKNMFYSKIPTKNFFLVNIQDQ